jgi:hypothetical protein
VSASPAALTSLIAAELDLPAPAPVHGFAAQLAAQHAGVGAVLFYGSSLRAGDLTGTLLDFYLIVDSYRAAYGGGWKALANRLLPPNVFYAEWADAGGTTYRAKYAVLSADDLAARCRPATLDVSIWARFAQPTALVWVRGDADRARVVSVLSDAVATAYGSVDGPADPVQRWQAVFAHTYGCEWRAERAGKGVELVSAHAERYRLMAQALSVAVPAPQPGWTARRLFGRAQHLARLVKAAFTFTGGIDYLAWKIERHSGVAVPVLPWHRRWPVLGGLVLFWQLRRRRAFR